MNKDTIFTKIRDGVIPSTTIYRDKTCFVILDINPVSKGHSLVIANESYANIQECPEEVLAHMIVVAKLVEAKIRNVLKCDGTNILINNDPASGQEVPHLHIHVIPRYVSDGQKFGFTHQKYEDGEMSEYGEKLKI